MHPALIVLAACVLAALLLMAWQLRLLLRLVLSLREEIRSLRRSGDLHPAPQPPPGEPPSEAFRSGLLELPPPSANPALTSIARQEPAAVVKTTELAKLVEGFKDEKKA